MYTGRPTHLRPSEFFAVPLAKIEFLQNDGRYWLSVFWERDGAGELRRRFTHVLFGSEVAVCARLRRHYGPNAIHLETRPLLVIPVDLEIELTRCEKCDGEGHIATDVAPYYLEDFDDVKPDLQTTPCDMCGATGWNEQKPVAPPTAERVPVTTIRRRV